MILAFVFIAIVLFENLFVAPLKESMNALKDDIAKREEIISGLESQQKGYDSITADLERSKKEYDSTVGLFPEKWDDALMLNFLEDSIGENLVKKSLNFQGVQSKKDYSVGTYTVTVHGHLKEVLDLLDSFETAKYYNTVSSINVPDYTFEEEEEVDVQFTINFYVIFG